MFLVITLLKCVKMYVYQVKG